MCLNECIFEFESAICVWPRLLKIPECLSAWLLSYLANGHSLEWADDMMSTNVNINNKHNEHDNNGQ